MRLKLLFLSVACAVACAVAACATATKPEAGILASPEELGIQDPDPDDTEFGPKFCNPTNKKGEELRQCYEYNESIYKSFDDEAKSREPWFNFTHDSWAQSPAIDEKFVVKVIDEAEAVKKLESAPLIELTAAEAQQLTGKVPVGAGTKPYLVRALLYYRDNGEFSVFTKDGSILVRHESFGTSIPPEIRSAVVVYLDFRPKEVFVDCGVAE